LEYLEGAAAGVDFLRGWGPRGCRAALIGAMASGEGGGEKVEGGSLVEGILGGGDQLEKRLYYLMGWVGEYSRVFIKKSGVASVHAQQRGNLPREED